MRYDNLTYKGDELSERIEMMRSNKAYTFPLSFQAMFRFYSPSIFSEHIVGLWALIRHTKGEYKELSDEWVSHFSDFVRCSPIKETDPIIRGRRFDRLCALMDWTAKDGEAKLSIGFSLAWLHHDKMLPYDDDAVNKETPTLFDELVNGHMETWRRLYATRDFQGIWNYINNIDRIEQL